MDEQEYIEVYTSIAVLPCLFEKAILALKLSCSHALRKNIAEREAVICTSVPCQARCDLWLRLVREKSQFSFHQTEVSKLLPHAKELKVQVGGIRGLNSLLMEGGGKDGLGIAEVIEATLEKYGNLESVPFEEVIQAIAQFKGRKKRE